MSCGKVALLGLWSCAASHPIPSQSQAAPVPSVPAAAAAASTPLAPAGPAEHTEWQQYFAANHVSGTIAILDTQDHQLSCSDSTLCQTPTIPASTFKIAHSMIALETGVVQDAETKLPWDGNYYTVPGWNQDNTLRSAIQVSCAPCFQGIARKVGDTRMAEWLGKLDYGNHDMSGGVDQFWLTGGLRISPVQQIGFLQRFDGGKLPIQPRTAETVRDLITLDVGRDYTLLGKTGCAQPPDVPELAAWFVGWLELPSHKVYFATLINRHEPGIDPKPARRRVTESVLRALELLPSDAAQAPAG